MMMIMVMMLMMMIMMMMMIIMMMMYQLVGWLDVAVGLVSVFHAWNSSGGGAFPDPYFTSKHLKHPIMIMMIFEHHTVPLSSDNNDNKEDKGEEEDIYQRPSTSLDHQSHTTIAIPLFLCDRI